MAFQFLCPQGHLLEGDEAHMGMTTQCPHCGTTFIIPTVAARPAEPAPEPQVDVYSQPYVPEPAPAVREKPAAGASPDAELISSLLEYLPQDALLESASSNIVHIPCPHGHELETPLEMIGQEVLCPHCGVQFRLRTEDSIEHRMQRERIESRQAQIWFKVAIGTAVVVFLGLFAMMIAVLID